MLPEEEEERIFLSVADYVAEHGIELEANLRRHEASEGLIPKAQLVKVLRAEGLSDKAIEYVICELALYSDSLEELNYGSIFDRFFMDGNEPDLNELREVP